MENEENKTGAECSPQGSQEKMFTQEAQLQERELKLQLREEMANHDIPKELSDIITVTDEKSISTAIKLLEKYIRKPEKGTNSGFVIGAPAPDGRNSRTEDPYRAVMGLK